MDQALPILYSYRRCPFAMRTRMCLWVSGMQCEVRDVSLREKPEALLQASPKGTVPVLVLPTGQVIDESLEIMHWALEQNDPYGWLEGYDPSEIEAFMQSFVPCVYRYKYPDRYEEAEVQDKVAFGQAWLTDNAPGVKRDFGLEDLRFWHVVIMPFIRQWQIVAHDRGDRMPDLWHQWAIAFEALPLFKAVMPTYPRWEKVGDEAWLLIAEH